MAVIIVAIPDARHEVHKISSEPVAHLTLMYLGEDLSADQMVRVVQFVQHAAETSLKRFGLSVDHRGELGEDNADVLFFSKDWMTKEIKEFIASLMANRDIYEAFSSAKQFPEWTPHLTLGYPERPAKEPEDGYQLSWINFDRIAVWTGDYEGPEFRLKEEGMAEEVSWSAISMAELVAMQEVDSDEDAVQYGVKGMRWGVRRSKEELQRGVIVDPDDPNNVLPAVKSSIRGVRPTVAQPELSNQQMRNLVERIRLEQEYAKLTASDPSVQAGQSATKKLAKSILRENFEKIARAQAANVLANVLEKKGQTHLADAVRSKEAKERLKKAEKEREKAEKKAEKEAADTPSPSQQTTTPPRSTKPPASASTTTMSDAAVRVQQNPAYRRTKRARAKVYEITTMPRN